MNLKGNDAVVSIRRSYDSDCDPGKPADNGFIEAFDGE
jgi:hypothetical protein